MPFHPSTYLIYLVCMCRGKAMHSCLCVCVCCECVGKEVLKNASSGVAKAFTDVNQWKTISIIRLGHFCTWCKSRRFFTPLFQLLPIISFVAPPLLKSHMVVTVSNASHTYTCLYWVCDHAASQRISANVDLSTTLKCLATGKTSIEQSFPIDRWRLNLGRTHIRYSPCVLTFVVSCTQIVMDGRWWFCRQWGDNSVWHSRCVHVLV